MDELHKKLTDEMERDLGVKLGKPTIGTSLGNGPQQPRQQRISEQIDILIADLNMRIDVLKRLKESL